MTTKFRTYAASFTAKSKLMRSQRNSKLLSMDSRHTEIINICIVLHTRLVEVPCYLAVLGYPKQPRIVLQTHVGSRMTVGKRVDI